MIWGGKSRLHTWLPQLIFWLGSGDTEAEGRASELDSGFGEIGWVDYRSATGGKVSG